MDLVRTPGKECSWVSVHPGDNGLYPEAISLCSTTASNIATELTKVFAWVLILRKRVIEQETVLTSKLMEELCDFLKMKALKTSIYYPQIEGLVECFNKTFKQMLRKCLASDPHH